MNLFVYTGAASTGTALVNSADDLTPVSRLPDVVFGDTEPLTVKFVSGANAFESWAGAEGYTLSVSIGDLASDQARGYVQSSDFTPISGGWSGSIPLIGAALATAVSLRPASQPYAACWLQIRVTKPSGQTETYARRIVNVGAAVSVADSSADTPVGYATYADVIAARDAAIAAAEAAEEAVGEGGAVQSVAGKTGVVVLVKADVGLGSVDNTPDASKPVSAPQQTALDAKADASALSAHTSNTGNPHSVTKAQVGLGNVPNVDTTNAGNISTGTLPAACLPALTGDVSTTAGSAITTLAATGVTAGAYGNATTALVLTVDAKGRVTAVTPATTTPAVGSITGLGSNVATFLATPTSANLAAMVTDETGSGKVVLSVAPSITSPITVLEPGDPTNKSFEIRAGNWVGANGIPVIRPTKANSPGVLDVLANGTGVDSWIDLGPDYVTTQSGEFLEIRKTSNGYAGIRTKVLAGSGSLQPLQFQGNGSGVIIGSDTVAPAGDYWLRVTGGKAYLGFDSGTLLTDASGGHGLRISPVGRTNSTERSIVELRTFNATATSGNAFTGYRAYGTRDTPTATLSGSEITRLDAYGYGASAISSAARAAIVLRTTQDWTDSAQGTEAVVQVTAAGGTTTATALTIASTGITSAGSVTASNGILSGGATAGTGGTSYGSAAPLTVYVKGVTIQTAGGAADIATIAIPAGISRYRITASPNLAIVAETAAGSLGAATIDVRDAAGGTGTAAFTGASCPAAAGLMAPMSGAANSTLFTSSTLYIRQTANSANAGTCSFYVTIFPIP